MKDLFAFMALLSLGATAVLVPFVLIAKLAQLLGVAW